MLKIFDFVPGWVWAVLLALALAVSGVNYVRMTHAQMKLAAYQAEVAENIRKAEADARAKEQALHKEAERIANEAANKQTVLAARTVAAERANDRLRDEIARLNARPIPADPGAAAFAHEARAARELLGACAERYRAVATDAEGLVDQVVGLQDFAKNVCK